MLKMSRIAQFGWGFFWTFVGVLWLDIVGTACLDARGGPGSASSRTLGAVLFCSPGILFMSVGVILLLRGFRNH